VKPLQHLFFAVAFTLAFAALFLPFEFGWQLVLLAAVSGILPDFDHWLALWKGISIAVFVALFVFFAGALESGAQFESFVVAAAAAFAVSAFLWVLKPFHQTIFDLKPGQTKFLAHGVLFLVLYSLLVFVATNSLAFALVAFLAYFSHLFLDFLAYETGFGRRYLMGWADWEQPEEFHVERLKRKRLAEQRASEAKAAFAAKAANASEMKTKKKTGA